MAPRTSLPKPQLIGWQMTRPFAAFDIDGTILRWQLYHAVADELAKQDKLDLVAYEKVRKARLQWKKRPHQASYAEYEDELVKFFETAIKTVDPIELHLASKNVVKVYKDQVYAYTRDLISDLKVKNYLLFAISASQDDIVKMLADYYGFDDSAGSVYEIHDGAYTGKGKILKSELKPQILKQLAEKHHAKWDSSIAVGDSESDIPMLSIVEQPIAFNPTRELFDHAKCAGWQVVVERKNMIYNLEPNHGKYKID